MGREAGNKQGRFLNARLVGKSKKNFNDLKETKVLALISIVGNNYCSGEYLRSTLETAYREHGQITVLLADEVYWHNLRETNLGSKANKADLKCQANKLGSDFFNKNMGAFLEVLGINDEQHKRFLSPLDYDRKIKYINAYATKHKIDIKICRWDNWINHSPGDKQLLKKLKPFYESEPSLKKSIEKTAEDFARRHRREGNEVLWNYRSKHYLTEESPAVMYLAAKRGYNFITYPGEYFLPFKATKDFFIGDNALIKNDDLRIPGTPGDYCNWLEVSFKRHVGHTITNIDPDAPNKAKAALAKQEEQDPVLLAREISQKILGDETIEPSLRLSILISALDEVRNNFLAEEPVQDKTTSSLFSGPP